jgi:biopolymer transport protein ExbB/TolQ
MSIFESIGTFFHEGGYTMYITATVGVCGFAVGIERGLKLYREYSSNSQLYMSRVKELMIQGRLEDAVSYSSSENGLLPKVVKSGLERVGCDETLVRQSMESTYLEQVPKITERIGHLSLVANCAMLFGLLGTVMGLIRQFSAVASADAAQKQLLMAKGIAESMNNTALGLMVAIPCLLMHGIYSGRANHLVEDLERGAATFLDWIGLHNYGQLQARLSSERKGNLKRVAEV